MTSSTSRGACATMRDRRNSRFCFLSIMLSARNSNRIPPRRRFPSLLLPTGGWGWTSDQRPSTPIARKSRRRRPSSGTAPWEFSKCLFSRKARWKSPRLSLRLQPTAPPPSSVVAIPSPPFISLALRTRFHTSRRAAALPSNSSADANSPASKPSPTNEPTNPPRFSANSASLGYIFLCRSFAQESRMRRRVIAGNWKMYKTLAATRAFFSAFTPLVAVAKHCDIVVAPPFTAISTAVEAARNTKIAIAGQNVSWSKEGAFTGEVSALMLAEAGCRYVIIGHSERRQLFRETDDNVAKKTLVSLDTGLTPIVCLGETQEDRDAGLTEEVLSRQFSGGPGALTPEEFSRILIAT